MVDLMRDHLYSVNNFKLNLGHLPNTVSWSIFQRHFFCFGHQEWIVIQISGVTVKFRFFLFH